MDGLAVSTIRDIAVEAAGQNVVVEAEGRELSTIPLHNVPREDRPDEPKTLVLHSLDGLADYVTENRDELVAAECMVHVASPTSVRVVSRLQPRGVRFTFAEARAKDLTDGFLNRSNSIEDFIVGLLSRFEDEGQRADILKIVGNVTERAELQVEDDGVSQSVTTRQGLKERSPIPNPVSLAPFRTFREVDQVVSPFIFRMKTGAGDIPSASLHEADGGAWELDAVQSIEEYLRDLVGDFSIIR